MKKYFCIFFIVFLSSFCGSKKGKIERILENGVEVIINQLEPYILKDTPTQIILEEELVIDTERESLAEEGISEISSFDIDLEGNIYCLSGKKIFQFNDQGNFVKSFGKEGQGPGEFLTPVSIMINLTGEIVVTDAGNRKFSFFQKDGSFIKDIKVNLNFMKGNLLKNGNYVFEEFPRPAATKKDMMISVLSLFDSEFNKIKELDKIEYGNPFSQKIKGTYHNFVWSVNANKIFSGNQERGYEIYVFDFSGDLLKKIIKKYREISPSEEYKNKYWEMFKKVPRLYDFVKNKIYFPSSLPPFHYFLTDDIGRIYVQTYEKGRTPGEFIFDIFNPEGIFICRKQLKIKFEHDRIRAKFKNNKFYAVLEKENGFEKLSVYKVIWKK